MTVTLLPATYEVHDEASRQNFEFIESHCVFLDRVNDASHLTFKGKWIAPTLINSWTGAEGYGYLKDPLGFVHLRGAFSTGASATTAFVLPAGYRPGVATFYTILGPAGAAGNFVFIDTVGNVQPTKSADPVRLTTVHFLAEN
jgi:hypothetical protein